MKDEDGGNPPAIDVNGNVIDGIGISIERNGDVIDDIDFSIERNGQCDR
jgi:hypothetical protein